ncbi:hypothetical protein [Stenotrophomonas bentonitica]|uniref:hypothetical protein n=1 Tax=Stenotrophomonas bentonitica TaxID=1450134 RepID=UPI00345E789D
MGVEIIYPLAWLLSLVAIALLLARARNPANRPYVLPTLLLSLTISMLLAWNNQTGDVYLGRVQSPYWQYLLAWFAPVVLVLGLHAHVIRWLNARALAPR